MARPKRAPSAADVRASARVTLWGNTVGHVREYQNGRIGFDYDPGYLLTGPSLSPRFLPLENRVFEFPELRGMDAFQGLPGALADSLPDTFGNLVIRKYFEERGEADNAMSPVQRLLYVGNRAMGALEYWPSLQRKTPEDEQALEVQSLVESARQLIEGTPDNAVHEIMRVGGSAGGARAKALILWNRDRSRVRSGFARIRADEEPWMIKFDGVGSANALDMHAKPFNRIEYTYALLAGKLGIDMEEVSFLEEPQTGLFHFMTRRFDRRGAEKIHMHSLAGMTHVDFNRPQAYSYEAWFRLIMELKLGAQALEQAYRRMVFNIVGRNQDDHVKNISFLLDGPTASWRLAPAYDLTFAAGSGYTLRHQMTAGGLSDGFSIDQLIDIGNRFDISRPRDIVTNTIDAFGGWPTLAREWHMPDAQIARVATMHRFVSRAQAMPE
jgi:serine/threonine-protein kinase HipA